MVRVAPWKSRSPLRPRAGGPPDPSFGCKLFMLAHASISAPSTERCSDDSSRFARGCTSTALRNFRATSPASRRSRFFEKVEWSHTGSSMPPNEPAKQKVELQPLHQLPLGTHRVETPAQQRPQQLLRRNRGRPSGAYNAANAPLSHREPRWQSGESSAVGAGSEPVPQAGRAKAPEGSPRTWTPPVCSPQAELPVAIRNVGWRALFSTRNVSISHPVAYNSRAR